MQPSYQHAQHIAENSIAEDMSCGGTQTGDQDMSALVALADVIPGMRALTSLDISDNSLATHGDMSGKSREHVFGLLIR
jgi:hypothetical protein